MMISDWLGLIFYEKIDAKWKLHRIENKTIVKGKKVQLNLHDGRNIIVGKDEYKSGDVLKITFEGVNPVSFPAAVTIIITGSFG